MNNFNELTGLYSLSKTLRFELRPIGKTKETFDDYWDNLNNPSADNCFAEDNRISKAKSVMKIIFDNLHEIFIRKALLSPKMMEIDFSTYLEKYRNRNVNRDDVVSEEQRLRSSIGVCFMEEVSVLLNELQKDVTDKDKVKLKKTKTVKEACQALGDNKMLNILKANKSLCPSDISQEDYADVLSTMKGYWGCLKTYFQNRNNYYECEKEQSTAIATRITSDLLPTFCSNILLFEGKRDAYGSILTALHEKGIETKIKNEDNSFSEINTIDFSLLDISRFNNTLVQDSIDHYNYEIAKMNSVINLCRQQFGKGSVYGKLKEFNSLHKQIGFKKTKSFDRICIEADKEIDIKEENRLEGECQSLEALFGIICCALRHVTDINNPKNIDNFTHWLENRGDYKGIYMTDKAIDSLLRSYLVDVYTVKEKASHFKGCAKRKEKDGDITYDWLPAVNISNLFDILDKEFEVNTAFKDEYRKDINTNISISKNLINLLCNQLNSSVTMALNSNKVKGLSSYRSDEALSIVKEWLDAVLEMCHYLKMFSVRRNKITEEEIDSELQSYLDVLLSPDWIVWYESVSAYLTQKPQDAVKDNHLKLNFQSAWLLQGWSEGQEEIKLSVIVKKDTDYYLCVLRNRKLFESKTGTNQLYNVKGQLAYKMNVKNLSFRSLTGKGYIRDYGKKFSEETDSNIAIRNIKELIQKQYLKKYPDLSVVIDKKYKSTGDFKTDVDAILSKYALCTWIPIDWDYLTSKNSEDVYIFKIHNKDFNQGSTGKKNLHTIYWESAFSPESGHRIGANGELFVQEPVGDVSKTFTHKKGTILLNKRDKNGNIIPQDVYAELFRCFNKQEESSSQIARQLKSKGLLVTKTVMNGHEIIKDKRFYNGRRYFFHCPLLLNSSSKAYKEPVNGYREVDDKINDLLMTGEDVSVMGIDRGEKHLVYWCKLNSDGTIDDCGNYDIINGTNYVELLNERAILRQKEQISWRQKSDIKNIKDGYVGQVINKIAKDVVIDRMNHGVPPAYIILEKLSREMKGKRAHIEKQIYQKFETKLANKLSFLVDKDCLNGPGSIYAPLQLVPPVNTYDDIDGKDSFGIMQYTRANYTSITDPLTGWRQSIYIQNGKSDEIKAQIMASFDDIRFDGVDYAFDYMDCRTGKGWTLYSGVNGKPLDRFFGYDKIRKTHYAVNVVKILDELFAKFDKSKSLKQQLLDGVKLSKVEGSSRLAIEDLRFAIKMIQQIRNSGNSPENDNFLQSPVRTSYGQQFDTRKAADFGELRYIVDGDANGAYNIARKGLIMREHRRYWIKSGCPQLKKKIGKKEVSTSALNLYVSDLEWDLWLQDRKKWLNRLCVFAIKNQ